MGSLRKRTMGGSDSGFYLQRGHLSEKDISSWGRHLSSRFPHGVFRGAVLTCSILSIIRISPHTWLQWLYAFYFTEHWPFLSEGTEMLTYVFLWERKASKVSFTVEPSQGKLFFQASSSGWRKLMFTEFGLNGKGWVRYEEGKGMSLTCPLQSQGSLKATYSSSLLYIPRLVLVGFWLASNWNCILAMLSKSLERWRWT